MSIEFNVSKEWSLFLDRDGVINRRIMDGYVQTINEFDILPGVLDTITRFTNQFQRIFIVTNQQGIGKGIMTHGQLTNIHNHLIDEISKNNGNIDAVYYAPQLVAENSNFRKPKIGMALKAKVEFPEVDLSKSIMIGDSVSDMQFGKNAGMTTIFIGNDENEWSDYYANTLAEVVFTL
jgi:histidinol-phosphate phosphatase family protein